jgi:phosphoglycerate-specific signal transduction histidine kinase
MTPVGAAGALHRHTTMAEWLDMTVIIPAALVAVVGVVGLRVWYKRWKERRVAARRRVEKPNSHYSSEGVRHQEDRERWGRIPVRSLHPLNQDEVQRLLDLVDDEGVEVLTSRERLFLDNMTLPRMG